MIYYINVDDTLIRTVGTKVIPMTKSIAWVNGIDATKNVIYIWSRGGAEYCKDIAGKIGINNVISGYLAKPDVMIDDQDIKEWAHLKTIHPNAL